MSVIDSFDHLRITSGNEEPEASLESAYAMSQEQSDPSLELSGVVSRGLSRDHDLEPQDKLVVPESKQMKNIHVSCHGYVILSLEFIKIESSYCYSCFLFMPVKDKKHAGSQSGRRHRFLVE